MTEPRALPKSWLARRGRGAATTLFCFAHAGGGSAFFRSWAGRLGKEIDVCPVLLPGRESRLREAPIRRMPELLDAVAAELRESTAGPFALFGHSVGAIVAYETARRLSAVARPPLHLIVSGRGAPQLPARRPPVYQLPERRFIELLRHFNGTPPELFADDDLLRFLLPIIRADFELNETYVELPSARLSCPVTAFAGDHDPEVDRDELEAWQDVTSGPFAVRIFHGDHFYLAGGRADVLSAIVRALRS